MSERPDPGRTSAEPGPPGSSDRWFWAVVAGVVLYAILDIIAQVLPPHYSAITQAESDLAVGPYGWIMSINFVNRGAFSLLFLVALAGWIRRNGSSLEPYRVGIALQGIWGVGALLLAAFPTDVPSTPVSWHGAIHLVVAILAFIGGCLGTLMLTLRLERQESLRTLRPYLLVIGALSVLFLLVDLGLPFVAPRVADRVGGLTERLLLGSVLLWIFVLSFYLGWKHPGGRAAATD
ncbi:MAG: DUF998 domain-containing protein [Thermoplasmata archaeon]